MDIERSSRLAGFTVVDVCDPAELDERSRVSQRLPNQNASHTYTLRDKALYRVASPTVLGRYAAREVADLQLCHVNERFGMEIGIGGDGIAAYCFGLVRRGRMALSVPDRDEVELDPGSGPVHRGQAGTRALTTDDTFRTNIWFSALRFESALQASLGEVPRRPLTLEPRIDWTVGGGGWGATETGPAARAGNHRGANRRCDSKPGGGLALSPTDGVDGPNGISVPQYGS